MILILLLSLVVIGLGLLSFILGQGVKLVILRNHFNWHNRRKNQPLRLYIAERHDFTDQLFSITLADANGRNLPNYRPGQFLTVSINLASGRNTSRRYSLASWQQQPKRYELAIRRLPDGVVSTYIHENWLPGCMVNVLAPQGEFVLQAHDHEVVLIAGGIGITPLRAMLHARLAKRQTTSKTYLFYSARHVNELCYHAEFMALAQTRSDFHYYPILTGHDAQWKGKTGRMTLTDIASALTKPQYANYYLCAGQDMTNAITQALQDNGIKPEQIHFELFSLGQQHAHLPSVTVQFSDYPVIAFSEPHLLACLERAGIEIASDCRTGQCGLCRVRLLAGNCRWLITPEASIAPDHILVCCTQPTSDVILASADLT